MRTENRVKENSADCVCQGRDDDVSMNVRCGGAVTIMMMLMLAVTSGMVEQW